MNELSNKQRKLKPLTEKELNNPEVISFTEKINEIAKKSDLEDEKRYLNNLVNFLDKMSIKCKSAIIKRLLEIEKI